jgi:diguanylate cyclase (GGDEF)-like protein
MSIKYKTLLIGILSVLSVIGATILIFYFSYFGYINKEQEQSIKRNFEVIDYIFKNEENNVQSILVDWGQWDDTYRFINDYNREFIDSNLQPDTAANLNLKSIIFLDNNKNIIYSKENNEKREFSEALVKKLLKNSKNFDKTNDQRTGFLFLEGKLYIVGILPITSSDKQAKSNGFLIMIRGIDGKLEQYMDKISPVNLTFTEAVQDKFKKENDISYINLNDGMIAYNKNNSEASKIIEDINGENSIAITTIDKSHSNEQINYFLRDFIFKFLCLIAIVMVFNTISFDKYIFKRLIKLTKFIEKVGTTKDVTLTINMCGKDEIYKLANAVNKMLSELNSANEEILFLNYTDKLTGLRNRAYMEKVFDALDKTKGANYHIIMGDLNGLKLTNDALGHSEGDKLICLVGEILKDNCAHGDIISRWGGDEFVILVKNKNRAYVTDLLERIKGKCENETEFHFKMSIGWGSAGSYEESSGTEAIMSLAEKRMYRNKLMENKSARSAAINSLLRTLHEKHSETEEHTIRIKNLSVKLGKRIGLPKEKLDELELLSSLHDIGKIGIPEQILMKPSKLTDEEWAIMKTHSNIGYRIASSTPELAHIANNILAHHERYDGTGYPDKLKGEEIPLLSRIINIVDSFDVMSHKRIYKDAYDKEYIMEELKRCSGTQFDPYLVSEFIALLEEENIC